MRCHLTNCNRRTVIMNANCNCLFPGEVNCFATTTNPYRLAEKATDMTAIRSSHQAPTKEDGAPVIPARTRRDDRTVIDTSPNAPSIVEGGSMRAATPPHARTKYRTA